MLRAFLADLTSARDSLAADLQQASAKQRETDEQLAASKAQCEALAKELQEAQQTAAAAAEEAAAAMQQVEQQLTELQEAQVCIDVIRTSYNINRAGRGPSHRSQLVCRVVTCASSRSAFAPSLSRHSGTPPSRPHDGFS